MVAYRIRIDPQIPSNVAYPAAVKGLLVNLLFNPRPMSYVSIVSLKALATLITTPTLRAVATMTVLDQIIALTARTDNCLLMYHLFDTIYRINTFNTLPKD